MQKSITVSAPGKLMLLGEHAVVYRYPCLATSIGQRMRATVEWTEEPLFLLNVRDVNVEGYSKPLRDVGKDDLPKEAQFVEIAAKNFLEKYPFTKGIKITMTSEFSSQYGFGSSSASTVCIVKALSGLFGKNLSQKELFDLSYKTVLDIQGVGSGFDVATAIYGGTLYFIAGGKTIEPINIMEIPLVVGYTGIKVDTTKMIKLVADKKEKFPEKANRIFQAIEKLVLQAKEKIIVGDWERVGKLMDFNQEYLRDLGVSSEKLEALISAAKKAGAYGAKLSGAGGGDCMIAVASADKRKSVEKAIEEAGGTVLSVDTNAEGVRVEV